MKILLCSIIFIILFCILIGHRFTFIYENNLEMIQFNVSICQKTLDAGGPRTVTVLNFGEAC